jgi:hypothetical protein
MYGGLMEELRLLEEKKPRRYANSNRVLFTARTQRLASAPQAEAALPARCTAGGSRRVLSGYGLMAPDDVKGDGRDLYRGAQLVLRWPRLHADLAMASAFELLLYCRFPRAEVACVRPEGGTQYAQYQLLLLEAVSDLLLPGGLPR